MKPVSEKQIGYYKIIKQLGAGGMGEVYLAEDTRLDRKVSIKLLKEEYTKSDDRMNRFVREAKTASSLNHPNIIVIHEIGESDGTKFIAAEYIEGETLRERFLRQPLTLEELLGAAVQIAEALAAAHKAKIIHRDIKPENIMVRPDGYVKILDFGLAKLAEREEETFGSEVPTQKLFKTNPGVVMGSAAYMSPEQARGLADVDERTDIFSLGIVLYEMLTGRLPFSGETLSELLAAVIHKDADSVAHYYKNCPPELERIVMKSLEKDREQRYQSVKDLALDLKSLKRHLEFETELGRKRISAKDFALDKTTVKDFIPPAVSTSSGSKDAILLTEFENLTGDPVFDSTLKMALAVSLEQSPFLNIFADERVRQTLPLMGRSPNERITKEIGREICQRKSLKAFITGTISNLGTTYVLTLEAVNAKTGETIGRQLEQADSKEEVLKALGRAASGLRENLGESLSSIEQFDAPLADITTGSLDALRAYALGRERFDAGKFWEAISFYKRAIELDSNFASAYAALGSLNNNIRQPKLAAEYAAKAFELRSRVSEIERFQITHYYFTFVTGEIEKSIETLELYKKTYPRDWFPLAALCSTYCKIGQFENAAAAASDAIKTDPSAAATPRIIITYLNLIRSLLVLNRFTEAKETLEKMNQKFPNLYIPPRPLCYEMAFIEGDTAAMQADIDASKGTRNEYVTLDWQTGAAAFRGEWRKSQDFSRRAVELAVRSGATEVAAQYAAEQALRIAFWSSGAGLPSADDNRLKSVLKTQTRNALSLERNKVTLSRSALALALAGESSAVKKLIDEMKTESPKDTLVNQLWIPMIKAVLYLHEGKTGEAVEELETAERYEKAAEFYPQYIRGLAYIKSNKKNKAIKEFEKILNHRGEAPLSEIYPLAQLGKARATKNKEDYEKFFEMWKDADKDMPALVEAQKEFKELSKAE